MIMKMKYTAMQKYLFSIVLLFGLFSSCTNPFEVDVSDIPNANVHINRYEQALFEYQLTAAYIQELQKQYPLFLGDLPLDSLQVTQLLNYVNDPYLAKLFEETENNFPDLSDIEQELSHSFRYIKYYIPSFNYPEVYSYISGSQEGAFFEDGIVVVSLDHYLGYGHESYNITQIPKYKQFVMSKEYFVRDVLLAIAQSYILEPPQEAHLIDHMIYHGKLLYFIKSMNPEISDRVLFAQTETHLDWLKRKERDLWRYYIENELLYKSDYMAYNSFINDAPFTSVLGDDSAPRTGVWLGYQIIYSYMKNNKVSFTEMLEDKKGQKILAKSGFKPSN